MQNIDLIRKIAWSFHHTTGHPWDDLFQEATLAYLEALRTYDPTRGALTTYMWYTISSALRNYLRREHKYSNPLVPTEELLRWESSDTRSSLADILPRDAMNAAQVILQRVDKYDLMPPREATRQLARTLHRRGMSWCRIWSAIRDLKTAFQ